jgi:hypothetical protein
MTAPEDPVPTGEDYGYDEAHDVPGRKPRGQNATPPQEQPRPAPRPVDRGGDYGYDEAHDHP